MVDNLSAGWHLGGAAIAFVLRDRPLRRFLAGSMGTEVVIAAVGAALAVVLRRHAGPVEYVLVGVASSYCLNLMVTAGGSGVAGAPAPGSIGPRAPPAPPPAGLWGSAPGR